MEIRILIADDHGVMRAGLRALLDDESTIEVVGEASSGEEVISQAGLLSPDIVLLDIGMPGIDGIETTRRLRQVAPQPKVLILTVYEDESLLKEAIKAGASGYIIKRAAQEELITAIHAVWRGDMYIHPAMTRYLVESFSTSAETHKNGMQSLTPRELAVMRYIMRGFTNRQTAETLSISVRTVESYRASLFDKLGIKNRVELIEIAEKNGLLS